jgi:hypothetical protein
MIFWGTHWERKINNDDDDKLMTGDCSGGIHLWTLWNESLAEYNHAELRI